ncbi:MAG: small subunit ribosomal protein S6 [Polaribacter sp.]|jgi:small subunit ribosomal protein S6
MLNYEVTFIVDPVLSGDEIKSTAQTYVDAIKTAGGEIVHFDEMGLRQLAYPIRKRTSGIYYCIELSVINGELIAPTELAFRRDERVLRFLTVRLDKFGVKYNADKRAGLIGKAKTKADKAAPLARAASKSKPKPKAKPAPAPAPVAASNEEE